MATTARLVNRIIMNCKAIHTLTAAELVAVDIELAARAAMLGKRGQVSKPHAAVRAELANR